MYLREFLLKFNHPITQYNTRQINTKVRVTDHKSFDATRFSLKMLKVKMMTTGSDNVCRQRVRERDGADAREKPGKSVSLSHEDAQNKKTGEREIKKQPVNG